MVVDVAAMTAKCGTVAVCLVLIVSRGIYAIVHLINALMVLVALLTHQPRPATISYANMNYIQNWAATDIQTAKTLSVLRSELILQH